MIDRLVSSPTIQMLEQTLSFTEQRHELILSNIANISTPGYVQQDVSVADFQATMQDAAERRRASFNHEAPPEDTDTMAFEPGGSSVKVMPKSVVRGTAFHDRGIRSMEDLMGQMADNAMAHNMAAELLKNRYDIVTKAINMKP